MYCPLQETGVLNHPTVLSPTLFFTSYDLFFPLKCCNFFKKLFKTKISHCVLSFQSVIISVIGQPPILNCCIYRGGEEKHFLKHKSYIIHIAQVISLAILMRRGHGNFSNHIRKSHCSIAQTCILLKSLPVKIQIEGHWGVSYVPFPF